MSFLLVLFCFSVVRGVASYSFEETFDEGWEKRWVASTDAKYTGTFAVDTLKPDVALKVPKKALHYGMTAKLAESFDPSLGVIVQFEAKYAKTQSCAGAYLKYYSHNEAFQPADMKDDTPYTIMFGPDACGSSSKVHLILNHKNPKSGEVHEKHLKSPPRVKTDRKTHVYTAVLKPDNTFELMVDGHVDADGSLFEKFEPPINPPAEIPDPDDKKPADWVDEEKIDDPEAVKPEDWIDDPLMEDLDATMPEGWLLDTPREIPDPDAVQPEDWDAEEDGEWRAPLITNPLCKDAPGCGEWKRPQKTNPNYKGPWKAPKIDNPAYKGEWKQATIPNPDFYEDPTPLKSMAPIGFVGLELWTMDESIFFDNILVTQDTDLAETYRQKWSARNAIEKEEEEEESKKAKTEREQAKKGESTFFLRSLLEHPTLSSIAPHVEPAVQFLENQSQSFWVFVSVVCGLLFSTLLRKCLRGGRRGKKDEAAERKKTDVSEPDDKPKSSGEASTAAGDAQENESVEDEPSTKPKSHRSN